MSATNHTSTNTERQSAALLDSNRTPQRIYGSSTPIPDRIYQPFVPPSDISSVTSLSTNSNSTTPRRRGHSENQSVPEGSSISASYQKGTLRPRSASNPTPKRQRTLEHIVSKRFVLPPVRKSLSTTFSKLIVSNLQSHDSDSSSSTGNVEPPAKKHKLAHKGQEFSVFKPRHKDRIYAHVLDQPDNILNEAKLWVQLYKNQASQAIISLLQFFVDVCGYQDFNVCSVFNFEDENYTELRDFMEENPPKYQKETGKYLMKASSNWSKQSHNAIYAFTRNLLVVVNSTEILFDSLMLKHLLGIVIILICSCNRSMHHTGVVIVVKMNTVFLEIDADIKKKIQRCRNDSGTRTKRIAEQLNVLERYKTVVCEVLKKLHDVIERHCCAGDPLLERMIITVIEEMFNWFEINPSLLSSTKYFRRLMTLVHNQLKRVRKAALVLCHKLISSNTMDNYMQPLIEKLVDSVVERVYDVDYGIAAYAVNICTDLLHKYSRAIPVLSRDRIVMLVYCTNKQLAMASGAFLMEIFHRHYNRDGEQNSATLFIKQLIRFSYLETENCVPLLVEAVLPYCPELSEWNTMIDLLLKGDDLNCNDKTKLIDIMSHAVQQTITGKSKINRGKGHPNIGNIRESSNIFIAKLYPLLKKYSGDPRSTQLLAEILLVIDYQDFSISKYVTEVISIINVLQSIFVTNTNKELLETISMVFIKFCEELSPFKNRAAGLVQILNVAVCDAFLDSVQNVYQTNDLSEDDLSKIEANAQKLSVLFINHDLTELVENNLFNWLTLEDIVNPESMKHIIRMGYWYVIWMLRKIIAKAQSMHELRKSLKKLQYSCDKYIEVCFNLLKNSENCLVRCEAFECICNVFVIFREDLKTLMESNPLLKDLLPNVPENNLTVFMTFAQDFLFEDKNTFTLKTRRISLGNVLNLAILGVIPFQELSKVYKYYHLHNDDYGDIFDHALQNVRESNNLIFVGIMLHTLVYCFTDTDITQSEARDNLRALTKRFQKFVSRSADMIRLILNMGIKYATFTENRYNFLYYLKYFIATLSASDRELILNFFTSRMSNLNTKLQVFTDFIGHLRNEQTTEHPVRQRTSYQLEEDEEDIEYETEVDDASSYIENYSIDDVSYAL